LIIRFDLFTHCDRHTVAATHRPDHTGNTIEPDISETYG
jgi:predicted secreted protein